MSWFNGERDLDGNFEWGRSGDDGNAVALRRVTIPLVVAHAQGVRPSAKQWRALRAAVEKSSPVALRRALRRAGIRRLA